VALLRDRIDNPAEIADQNPLACDSCRYPADNAPGRDRDDRETDRKRRRRVGRSRNFDQLVKLLGRRPPFDRRCA
jgi:hypothetical protein